MDPDALRRGRRIESRLQWDLTKATTDEEACPPVWLDLATEIRAEVAELLADVQRETERFAAEPDVRVALRRRERVTADVRRRVERLNPKIRRMNLLAPLPRFQRPALDADELVRPLYRTRRRVG